ncbi:MAG: PQQ-binding-like beta-propeller repeat protein [Vicinamibacterales bacterium]
MRRFGAVLTVLVLGLSVQAVRVQRPSVNWADFGGTPDNARHVALSQIDKSNLDRLGVAWSYPTQDTTAYVFNPVVVDNVAYVLARNDSLVALDASTGREIWIHENLKGIAPRGINYWESADRSDRRLLFQMNSYLQAIDARTGKSILTFGTDGAVNLREGLRRDPAALVKVQSSNPGKVYENLIILGSAAGENYLAPPGDIRAYDVVSGRLVWQFHTVPHPGEFGYDTWPKDAWTYVGGANTWGELSIDAERGIVYIPTGSPTYDYYGADRIGANLFGTSLVALDARSGKRLWHFQMVHHDLWDYDNTAAPQLATIVHEGRRRDIVAQAGKTGFLYVFDRVTGEPIWPIEEKPFPASDVPGEKAWPTQPIPTAPPPFARQSLTVADVNPYILTARQRTEWQARIGSARTDGLFVPPSLLRETVAIPGAQGGANWGTTAADPARGIVYVLSINVPSIYKLSAEEPKPGAPINATPAQVVAGRGIYQARCQSCHRADLRGGGSYPTLDDITGRIGAVAVREKITGGGPGMPSFDDFDDEQLTSLIGYLANPSSVPSADVADLPPDLPPGPVVASGGAPGGRSVPEGRAGGMVGPDYPRGIPVPEIRMYTGYGMNGTIVKPPYSTLTAYDLNTGTIKWQVPAGGDDLRGASEGAKDTGYIRQRTGIITTPTGLLFQAGSDLKLRVYDADTGTVLWTAPLPAGSRGIPAMYEANGRQFFLVNATSIQGNAAGLPPPPGSRPGYVAFALPEASPR